MDNKRQGGLHKTKQHMVSVRFETHAKLKVIAKSRGCTLNDVIAGFLDKEESTN